MVRIPGWPRPAVEWARVADRRAPEDAEPGHPAGYSLAFDTAPAELRAALASRAPVASYGTRAAPRFQLGVPLRTVLEPSPPQGAPEAGSASATALVGSLENLSMGGAFVRVERGPAPGTELRVRFRLPSGALFDSHAAVAFRDARGVGLRFILDRAAMNDLHDALTLLSAHPRRALVIDDDALARKMVADALVERGFEVLTASDAPGGLHLLAEEALAIDLLVTDLILPDVDGEALVATIRKAGGEADLTVIVMTARPDALAARRLQAAGADLLMGKDLGPELIAQRADQLMEARRHPASPRGRSAASSQLESSSAAV
jgi:CheY-like chemotaxis protein